MEIARYSIGTGDRFGLQGQAQLAAVQKALGEGVELAIVWNKSHREHSIVGTDQTAVMEEANQAVQALGWRGQYFVDADHIGLGNVDLFIESSNFYTLDVADFIGKKAEEAKLKSFVNKYSRFIGELAIPGMDQPLLISEDVLQTIAEKYLYAVQEAGKIYRYIEEQKGGGNFITEVSMDETAEPQSPIEMLFILAAIADEKIPAQTIAPKFSGRFNKGVDYIGDVDLFYQEFEEDLCVIKYAVEHFGLPKNLKLSVHSGSDKFSIYKPIRELIAKHGAGIHVKTAGTTWLEELIGLAESGGEGLSLAKQIYASSYQRFDELCDPYASVIDIDKTALPTPAEVQTWSSEQYVHALRHDQSCSVYDTNLRQLLHVGYKVAAELGDRYLNALRENKEVVAKNVMVNLFERHIRPLFL